MLSDLAFVKDFRQTRQLRFIDGGMPYRCAADRLLQTHGPVLILTGFYILNAGAIETDGLTGSRVLWHVLRALGREPLIPADAITYPVLSRIFPADAILEFPIDNPDNSRQRATEIFSGYSPGAVIAIERPGPMSDGTFRNAAGHDISSFCSHMEYLWPDKILKIGIGDGGNELGMGRLSGRFTDSCPVCAIGSDCTLLGSTSDFAAWCLGAALEIVTGKNLLPPPESIETLLGDLHQLGVVDGLSGKPAQSIDGYDLETLMNQYRLILRASACLRKTSSILSNALLKNRERYDVPVIDVQPLFDPGNNGVILSGHVLLDNQLDDILRELRNSGITVTQGPFVLTDPDRSPPGWLHVPSRTCDLLDRPGGQRTTQIADYDGWIRRLIILNGWSLIQTPDMALGWSNDPDLVTLTPANPTTDPWASIQRAKPGTPDRQPLALKRLIEISDTLLGIPYLWGGRSMAGLDCSGMVQRIFYSLGYLLPRHSTDQRRCGSRVSFSDIQPGDLVYAVRHQEGFHHTGIILPGGIQHACRTRNRVLIEPFEDFRTRYRLIAVRRISPFA